MSLFRPLPELIKKGKWKTKQGDTGESDVDNQVMQVPFGSDERSVALRNHEYFHVKWSPSKHIIGKKAKKNPQLGMAMNSIEDSRINYLGEQQGIETSRACIKGESFIKDTLAEVANPYEQANIYLACRGYDAQDQIRALYKKSLDQLNAIPVLDSIEAKMMANPSNFKVVEEQASRLVEFFKTGEDPEQEEQEAQGGGQGGEEGEQNEKSDKNQQGEKAPKDAKGEEGEGQQGEGDEDKEGKQKGQESEGEDGAKNQSTSEGESEGEEQENEADAEQSTEGGEAQEREETEKGAPKKGAAQVRAEQMEKALEESEFGARIRESLSSSLNRQAMRFGDNGIWGNMKLLPQKLTEKIQDSVQKGPRASDFGSSFRYIERYGTDKKMFPLKNRYNKKKVGTILVDISGSMSIDKEQLKKIMGYCRGLVVATYSGNTKKEHTRRTGEKVKAGVGYLQVVVKDGRMVDEIINTGGRNIVDGPALRWLAKQKGPRVYVGDAYYNGSDGTCYDNLRVECEEIIERYRIARVPSLRKLEEMLELDKIEKQRKRGRK